MRLGQRGFARRVAVDLALGYGMTLARGIGLALRRAPGLARGTLGRGGRLEIGFRGLHGLTPGAGLGAGLLQLILDVDQPRPLGEPACRAGRGVGGGDKAVPAPDVAFQRDQPLAGPELRHQFRAALLRHHADLRQAAGEFDRRLDMRGERLDTFRQRRIALGDAGVGPAHRRRRIDRRIEIVAEGSAKRLLKTLGDGDAVDDRRPQILGFAVDQLRNGARLGLQPLHPLVGVRQRRAGGFQLLAGGDVARFDHLHGGLGLREALLRGLHGAGEHGEVAKPAGFQFQFLLFDRDVGDLLVEPRQPVAMAAHIAFELVPFGGEVGERGSQLGKQALGGGQCRFSLGDALVDAAALFDAGPDLFLQLGVFGIEPAQRHLGVGGLLLLARDVGRKLHQPAVEFGDALLGALFLAVEGFARAGQPLQSGRGPRLGLAQRRQFGSTDRLNSRGFRLFAGALGHLADREVVGGGGFGNAGMGLDPAQVKQQRLGLAHFGGDLAVADRLPRLLLQAVDLAGQLPDHVLDAGKVGFGRLQPQLGFMAAGMKPGDAGGVFQHAAALLGLGLDDLADLALVHQRRRTCAGGGVRKQDLHVAGTHVAAVDAIDRAGVAFDPARDFQHLAIVEGGRRRAVGIVDRHHHFGVVARGTVAGAREDHRVHVGGAQRLVRGLAHRPAQRLDQVGLAAAVRPDHAGQARFDQEIRGLDERLETVEAKAGQLHGHRFSVGRARISLPGQYHRRQCRCVGVSRFSQARGATMARRGLEGNRRPALFPRLL